jgi:hypothetical protein
MYSFIESQKGSKGLLYENNLYRLQKNNKNGTSRWVCTNRKCSSSLTLKKEKIYKVRGIHKHNNVRTSLSITNVVKEIREEVCINVSKPITQIYNETVSQYVNRITLLFFLYRYYI